MYSILSTFIQNSNIPYIRISKSILYMSIVMFPLGILYLILIIIILLLAIRVIEYTSPITYIVVAFKYLSNTLSHHLRDIISYYILLR